MRIRFAVLITALALLAPASTALAQDGNPFNGIPPALPTPAPTVAPSNNDATTSSALNERKTLFLIGGGLLVTFFGIGWWIARDARRNLPQDERDRLDHPAHTHKHELQAKAKARAKGRAQRQARKASRKAKARR